MEKDKAYFKKLHDEFKLALKTIKEADRIVIFRHQVPDFDALGTQMGLATWIKESYPEKEVHYVGEGHHAFIPRIFPEPEVLSEEWYKKPFLAIVVDTADTKRISGFHPDGASKILKLDHHPEVEKYADISIVHPEMSAASELVALMLLSMGKAPLSKEAARYFYIGIVGDSGRFLFPEVSPMTLRVSADLLETGIDKKKIYAEMYLTSQKELEFKKDVLNRYKITPQGTCYYIIDDKTLKKYGLIPGEGKIGLDFFRNIEGVTSEVSITEDVEHNEWRLSFRSNCKKVSKVAALFEGGGHDFAAGGKMHSLDDLPRLLKELDDLEAVKE